MDYSFDICFEKFTAGQARRMRDMWLLYREGTSAMGSPIPATIGVPLTGISLGAGSRQRFVVENVPILSVASVTTTGNNGDADLVVGLCSSLTPGSSIESCDEVFRSEEGTLVIEVLAVEAFTDLTLTVTIESFPLNSLTLGESLPLTNLQSGAVFLFSVEVPGNSAIQVELSGDNGDADLEVFSGNKGFDTCASVSLTSMESCIVYVYEPSTVYIIVSVFNDVLAATLTASIDPGSTIVALNSGTPVTDISLVEGDEQFFVLNDAPAGSVVKIETAGGMSGNAHLFVYSGSLGNEVCASETVGSEETCEWIVNSDTPIFIEVYANSTFTGLSLNTTVTTPSTAFSILLFILNLFVQIVLLGSG